MNAKLERLPRVLLLVLACSQWSAAWTTDTGQRT
jgi:hypothetical protein